MTLDHLHDRSRKLGTKQHHLGARLRHVEHRIVEVKHKLRAEHRDRHEARTSYAPHAFDTCPVSLIVHLVLADCRAHGLPFGVISGDRRDGVAQRFGHSSQQELWLAFQNGTGLPANPPGSSTHEYVNGGNGGTPAYHDVSAGAHLAPYRLGLDLRSNGEATRFCADAKALGYHFWQPYPTTSEAHHVNLLEDPYANLVRRHRI